MNLKKGLFTLIFMIGTLCLTYGQAPSYPWLDGVVSDNCCSNQTATAYDFGTYSFVYIEANGECTPGGKLYFEDGTCWCVDKDGTSCLDFYIPSSTTGQEIYNCEGAVNFTPFDQFDWLSGIANAQDCSANPAITVYLRSGQHFIHVLGANGLGQLYSQSGRALCSDQENYSCRTAYNLSASNQTLSWTCGEGAGTGNVADITMRNTLQDPGEAEATYASLFGAADDAYDEFATFSATASEFPTALAQPSSVTGLPFNISGLYDIDITASTIDFTLLPDENDPFWIQQFGVFPAGKFDRYYLTFAEPHGIIGGSSTNGSVNLRVDSENVVVVELSEGYNFNPGMAFTINLIKEGSIVMRNTLQDPGEAEATYASLFGAADDAYDEFATFSATASEFPTALAQPSSVTGLPFNISGLYDIDITASTIDFTLLPDETDPFWIQQFGVFPAGKFDRYYLTFAEPHNIVSGSSTNGSVNLRVDSETVVVVELSEGYDFNPGMAFTINLNKAPLNEGNNIVLRNTLQDPGEAEATYASLFGQADDAFDEMGTFSNSSVEFPTALAQPSSASGLPFDISGLYSIDLTSSSIEFTVLPDENDPFWTGVYGLFPAGKFDRYYLTFAAPHNITSAASNHGSVALKILSETEVVVEISEGYDLQPGVSFFISLNMAEGLTNEEKARAFNTGLVNGDRSVTKWIHEDYIQHNLGVPTGKAPIVGFYGGQPTGITVDVHRSFQVGDFVFAQTTLGGTWGQFFGSGTDNLLYEVWRFEDGFAIEHWDNIVAVVDDMDGTSQTDGVKTPAIDLDKTDANKALLEEMAQTLFVGGDWTNVRNYFDIDNYVQHSVGSGTDGAFLASLEGQTGVKFYDAVKFTHVLGNFGLVMSEGPDITGQDPTGKYAYYDLFRVENGKIVEHWDAIQVIPPSDQWAHSNGKWGDDAISGNAGDNSSASTPLKEGMDITLRNTLQDAGEAENTYASLFGAADDAFDEFATLSNSTSEFPTALSQSPATGAPFDIAGLYDIDLTENSISFSVLPDETDTFWTGVFGLFPEGKVDRYYLTFSEPHNITGFTSDNPFLNVRIDSENVIVVELTGGYDLKPGVSFTVDLN